MELKEFIKDTIVEIGEGIIAAKDELSKNDNIHISPSGQYSITGTPAVRDRHGAIDHFVTTVKITVNVEAIQSTDGNGNAKFNLKVISGAIGENKSESSKECQEVSLTLPVVFTF